MKKSNPNVLLSGAITYKATQAEKGNLCNAYAPLQNLVDEGSETMGNFTTEKLKFDMEHPVDILLQDSYDGAVNILLNDGKNRPKSVNSRFSVQNDTKFKIPDHVGYKDTNIYEESTFETDTALKAISRTIPTIRFGGLINNAGTLKCGSYSFYFKLSDVDGNETEIVQESGVLQIHIGNINEPESIRMGMEDENSNKAVKFKLTNIDSGFDYIHVLFVRHSSGNDLAAATNYFKVNHDYPVVNGTCDICITGNENIMPVSRDLFYIDYADINSVKTQVISNNVLCFGNVDKPEHDWAALLKMSWKIIPSVLTEANVGYLTKNYEFENSSYYNTWNPDKLVSSGVINLADLNKEDSKALDASYCYYNQNNVYYKVGYWPDEIYRFGVVYIFEDMSLSPVFNIQGVDFNKVQKPLTVRDLLDHTLVDIDPENQLIDNQEHEWENEPEDCWFNKEKRLNSRGVIKMPCKPVFNSGENCHPAPMYIQFDLSKIGYKIENANQKPKDYASNSSQVPIADLFAFHKIKGFFFVRLKRIPTILAQGLAIGLTKKDYGSLPVIKDNYNQYITLTFLLGEESGRLLATEGRDITIKNKNVTVQAMLVPDAEMMEATFNQLFVGNEYAISKIGQYTFRYNDRTAYPAFESFLTNYGKEYKTVKLLNIPEDTKILTDGQTYFSTLAGNASEAYKTKDVRNAWKYTPPQDLTISTSVVRGQWGAFVGVTAANDSQAPLKYGEVYNIKKANYAINPEEATDLDFIQRFKTLEMYSAISDRLEYKRGRDRVKCYRGDCFLSMFTHRVLRNFIDPELPTNTEIVNPATWAENYGVRCTAEIVASGHSNMTKGTDGWIISTSQAMLRKNAIINIVSMFLTGNALGGLVGLINLKDLDDIDPAKMGLGDDYVYFGNPRDVKSKRKINKHGAWCVADYLPSKFPDFSVRKRDTVNDPDNWPAGDIPKAGTYYKVAYWSYKTENLDLNVGTAIVGDLLVDYEIEDDQSSSDDETWADKDSLLDTAFKRSKKKSRHQPITPHLVLDSKGHPITWDSTDILQLYPNGFANEIVQAFEVFVGDQLGATFNPFFPIKSLVSLVKYGADPKYGPTRKKVEPKELEKSGGLNLKAIFKSSDNWELRGLSNLNRADVNAVGLGQWITFPICSTHNLALRDVDFSNATEEASFARKRSFYPLVSKDMHNPLRDSNIINQATALSIPDKKYHAMPNVPYIKQEYFTRIYNSLRDSANTVADEFKSIFETAYNDYTKIYGSITKLIALLGNIFIVFKHGMGLIKLQLSALTSSGFLPDDLVMVSDDFGSIWKDSIIQTPNGVYGLDTVAKKIWFFNGQSLQMLSDHVMGKFLIDNLDMSEFTRSPYAGHINVKSHYNAFKHDVIFTYYKDIPYDELGNEVQLIGDNSSEAEALRESIKTWESGTVWSLCYNEDLKKFTTFYDWIPIESENIDNIYFSFDREESNNIADNTNTFNLLDTVNYPENYFVDKKFVLDSGFNNSVRIYYSDSSETDKTVIASGQGTITGGEAYALTFYYKSACDLVLNINDGGTTINNALKTYSLPSTVVNGVPQWLFYVMFINDVANYTDPKATFGFLVEIPQQENSQRIYIADAKLSLLDQTLYIKEIAEVNSVDPIWIGHKIKVLSRIYDFLNFENLSDPRMYWELRNALNNVKLWKHGQSGVYDNQGEIKPTNWYGKQREFNFEFIVNSPTSMLQKIYNNLKMLSNKVPPHKFEYEVVGEGYEWYEMKPVIVWANNEAAESGRTLDDVYIEILNSTIEELQTKYNNFPTIFNKLGAYKIGHLPYLRTALLDRKGTKDELQYINLNPKGDSYSDNSSDTILVYDKQLNECRVHTEQLGNDMKKYGRVRGNMEYLEDYWNVEIRPLHYYNAYITPESEIHDITLENISNSEIEGLVVRPADTTQDYSFNIPVDLVKGQTYNLKINIDPSKVVDKTKDIELVIKTTENTLRYTYPSSMAALVLTVPLKMNFNASNIEIQVKNLSEISFEKDGEPLNTLSLHFSEVQEARHRDKYIKIKVRYDGKDLAIIQALGTLLLYSQA